MPRHIAEPECESLAVLATARCTALSLRRAATAARSARWATTTPATCWRAPASDPPMPKFARTRPHPRSRRSTQLLRDTRTTARHAAAGLRRRHGPAALSADARDRDRRRERKAFPQQQMRQGLELRAWWVQEMLATPSPLTERMTLFWHNHFVSSQQKVRFARLMYRQNVDAARARARQLRRRCCTRRRRSRRCSSISTARKAARAQPNENFAREVMELFTLGEGQYTEQDIKEAARAFTGWSLDRETGQFLFRPRAARHGTKTVLGTSGALRRRRGARPPARAAARPREYVTAKLWREFVSPDPDPREVQAHRAALPRPGLRHQGRARASCCCPTRSGPRTIAARWSRVPVELVVGTLRQLERRAGAPRCRSPSPRRAWARTCSRRRTSRAGPAAKRGSTRNTLLARKQFLDRSRATMERADAR